MDKRWFAWSLLGSAIILVTTWYKVQLDVEINEWFGGFYDLIQKALGQPGSISDAEYYAKLATFGQIAGIYIFVAVFWALFDQTGSSWVLQAEDLNRNWLGLEWLPSQIQAVNPIMILVYIPVFTLVVYPLLGRVVKLRRFARSPPDCSSW